VSSTNLFHSLGLQFTGAVAIARCSNHSMNKFAIMGDTGLLSADILLPKR